MNIKLNMYLTNALIVLILLLSNIIKKHVKWFQYFCIPKPVIGGFIYIICISCLKRFQILDIQPDMTLSDCFMLLFYSSIGFKARISTLKKGSKKLIVFLGLSIVLALLQNIVGVGLAMLLNIDPLAGLACGSISMTGGHGTSAAFASVLEDKGLYNAISISLAAATFGLISGSIIGGPIGKFLSKNVSNLSGTSESIHDYPHNNKNTFNRHNLFRAIYYMLITVAIGNIISAILEYIGFTFPASVGAMVASVLFVNAYESKGNDSIPHSEIDIIGELGLLFFLTLSMMSIKPWQLIDLALPMLIILSCQVLLMVLFSVCVTYPIMGRDRMAAFIASGHCGFGLGAVPTAIANMLSLEESLGNCPEAFIIVPLVGSLLINFFNSIIITLIVNLI